jgi:nucleoside-diphosphate-sugar epimerase
VTENLSKNVPVGDAVRTVLVTGAAGFIGSSLVARSLEAGLDVRGLDVTAAWRMEEMGILDQIEWFEGDVRDAELIGRAMDGVDLVYLVAAIVVVDVYIERR